MFLLLECGAWDGVECIRDQAPDGEWTVGSVSDVQHNLVHFEEIYPQFIILGGIRIQTQPFPIIFQR